MDNKIKEDLQSILNTAHWHTKKQEIKETKNSYQFACPVCGDSEKDPSRKRAHVLFDKANPYFYCHHECGGMSMERFYSHFNMKYAEQEDQFGFFQAPVQVKPMYNYDPKVKALSEITRLALPINMIIEHYGAERVDENHPQWEYLVSRNLTEYKDYFLYWPEKHRLIILNTVEPPALQRKWNENGYYIESTCQVIGFQARGLGNHKVKYITYTLEKLYGEIGLDWKPAKRTEEYVKTLSQVFFSTHVDWEDTVLITEGPIDALFLENSISIVGASKRYDKLDLNHHCQYIFDNDETGRDKQFKKASQYSNKQAFFWNQLCKQIGTTEVKDINDVVNYCKKQNIEVPNFKIYLK